MNDLTSEKIRHYVLANLLCFFGVNLVIEDWFKQTHCVSYFTKIRLGFLIIISVGKSYTMCWIIYCVSFGYFWSLKSGLSRYTVLAIPRILIQFCYTISPVNKSYTMCQIIYCVNLCYIWSLKSEWSRHTVLAIPKILIQFCCIIWPVKKAYTIYELI